MFVNKIFIYLSVRISKSKRCFNVKSSTYYFHTKTKIVADFQISISAPCHVPCLLIPPLAYCIIFLYSERYRKLTACSSRSFLCSECQLFSDIVKLHFTKLKQLKKSILRKFCFKSIIFTFWGKSLILQA